MCNWLSKILIKIVMGVTLLVVSTSAGAETRCEFIKTLEGFQVNADILALSDIPYNSAQIQNAKRNIRNLIQTSDGKEELLNMTSIYPDREKWLDNYLISWIKLESAYDAGGWRAASQLLSSTRFRQGKADLADIKYRLGCDGSTPETVYGAISQLNINSLSRALGLSTSGYREGIAPVMALIILIFVLILGTIVFWSIFRFETYRKDCAKRYNCEVTVLTKGKYGEIKEKTVNISRNGACFTTDKKYSQGEAIWVLLDQKWQKSKVAWIGGPKVGVKFRFKLRRVPSFVTSNETMRSGG